MNCVPEMIIWWHFIHNMCEICGKLNLFFVVPKKQNTEEKSRAHTHTRNVKPFIEWYCRQSQSSHRFYLNQQGKVREWETKTKKKSILNNLMPSNEMFESFLTRMKSFSAKKKNICGMPIRKYFFSDSEQTTNPPKIYDILL